MKKQLITTDIALVLLCLACIGLALLLAMVSPTMLLVALIVIGAVGVVLGLNIRKMRKMLARLLHGAGYADSMTQMSLAKLSMPVLILSGKSIVWYNDAFLNQVVGGAECYLQSVYRVLPGFDTEKASLPGGQPLELADRRYTVTGAGVQQGDGLFIAYFCDDTELKEKAAEYDFSRPVVMRIVVDTYDEVVKELKESEKARISGEIDAVFEGFIEPANGFLLRTSSSRYIAVMERRYFDRVIDSRFDLLDKMRAIGNENCAVTLSIGVGLDGFGFEECLEMADSALDMALGRGGDQAAVKSRDGFEFYGGVSRSVEKRTKVKSRIVAAALADIIKQSDSVLVMGHKMSDLDSIGSAIGILRICKILDKPAAIVVDQNHTLAEPLIHRMVQAGAKDDFVAPADALPDITRETLLVVVDTHAAWMLESAEVFERVGNVVVIDHHRKVVGHIDNAVIFYHEPYASSASELVAELLQYTGGRDDKPTQAESEALLAGIMLDTRDFVVNAGVRTFEAAAYLRRMGAQTQNVKRLFSGTLENYAAKANLVESAVIHAGCAIVIAQGNENESAVVVPQAANDLLLIEGVQASFVAVEIAGTVQISARSMGDVNVQVIMEKLGGGGHLMMAGAQLKDVSLEKTRQYLIAAVDEYRAAQSGEK